MCGLALDARGWLLVPHACGKYGGLTPHVFSRAVAQTYRDIAGFIDLLNLAVRNTNISDEYPVTPVRRQYGVVVVFT